MGKSLKRAASGGELGSLPAEVTSILPSIHDDPALVAAGEKLHDLEQQLQQTHEELQGVRNYPDDGPVERTDAQADALILLSGGELDVRTAPESKRAVLLRRAAALDAAVGIQRERRRALEIATIKGFCAEHSETVLPYFERAVAAFEALDRALSELALLSQTLAQRGWTSDHRPRGWDILPHEQLLLCGGRGIPTLRVWAENRRETLGLNGQGKKKGK